MNKAKGNMYEFITHTWNPVKGICLHGCTYCYMEAMAKRFSTLNVKSRIDEKEMNQKFKAGQFVFVCSSCDLFAQDIPIEWINKVIEHCGRYPKTKFLLHTKNPGRIKNNLPSNIIVCITIETNRYYPEIMNNAPWPYDRFVNLPETEKMITIEPIMDFDFNSFVDLIEYIKPSQVNIGADSGNNNLPEPSKEKIELLVKELEKFTKVVKKKNLKRLLK